MRRLLLSLLFLSLPALAIEDKDSVQNMPHSEALNYSAPAVEFTVKQEMFFAINERNH